MTVAENIFLGTNPVVASLIDELRMLCDARDLLERFACAFPRMRPSSRSVYGEKQLVEIVKALAKRSRILILDEPTAALAEHEGQILLGILRDLRSQGIACVYISHKLDEVFAIADRITVLRDGSSVFTAATPATSKAEIIRHMVGREIADLFPRRAHPSELAPIFSVEGLTVAGQPRAHPLRDISFAVAEGEVLGIGGLMGAGRTELSCTCLARGGRESAVLSRSAAAISLPGLPTR
jgi:D-xylose transport system ATP-binding protein